MLMSNQDARDDARNSLSLDRIYELLAQQRRRNCITCLYEHGPLPLADLADEIACDEYDAPITEIPEDEVLRVYLSLYHTHIPKLAEANVVEYTQQQDIVLLGENAEVVKQFLPDDSFEGKNDK